LAQQANKGGNIGMVQNRAASPRRPLNPKENSFGAIEFAGRYSEFRVDPEAFLGGFADIARSATPARAFALGVNWYLARMVKFVLNYEQTRFDGGSAEGDRLTEHALLSRFQIGF
jgi:phosphate-selective porin OprO and OprP